MHQRAFRLAAEAAARQHDILAVNKTVRKEVRLSVCRSLSMVVHPLIDISVNLCFGYNGIAIYTHRYDRVRTCIYIRVRAHIEKEKDFFSSSLIYFTLTAATAAAAAAATVLASEAACCKN